MNAQAIPIAYGDGTDGAPERWPVFEGLERIGLNGRDVARLAGVTPPTVSKWRACKVRIPGERLAFLTLVLAHLMDDVKALDALEAAWAVDAPDWGEGPDPRLVAARDALQRQERLNMERLPVDEVRKGARLFREWWSSGAALQLQNLKFKAHLKPEHKTRMNGAMV